VDLKERRWFKDGRFTFFNRMSSFLIVKTEDLREYLNTKKVELVYTEIFGHPLGLIRQEIYLDRYVLYASGVGGGPECWGILDLVTKKNYFIDCCGFKSNNHYATPCNRGTKNLKRIVRKLITLIKEKRLKEISNHFHKSVLKLIR